MRKGTLLFSLLVVSLLFAQTTLAITGPEVAQLLNSRYKNTTSECAGDNPAYFCSGVLLLPSQGPDQFWKPDAPSTALGARSFAYVRADLDKTLEGGTLVLWYNLLSEGPNGDIVRRESLHAALLQVGEPQFELAKPIVLGEKDGRLDTEELPNGVSKLTVLSPTVRPTKAGDKVTFTVTGEVSDKVEDWVDITRISEGRDVHFPLNAAFVRDHFEVNRGKKPSAVPPVLPKTTRISVWPVAG